MNCTHPYIVVGLDSSQPADAALRWAAREARLRGAVLRVIHAWRPPDAGVGPHSHARDAAARDALRDTLDRAGRVLAEQAPDVDVSVEVPARPAGPALVDASAGAELLAVGRHGARRPPGENGVDHYCVAHSRCPVVVVPLTSRVGDAGSDAGRRQAPAGHGHAVRAARQGRHGAPRPSP
jgi:nucleotide-binding universal stress UspA family protein